MFGACFRCELLRYKVQNCEALLDAYRRIRDPEMRRRLLTLVQATAERS